MSLTPKREAFARAIVSGMNQADAYREAYGQKTMSDTTLHQAASRLMSNSNVLARVEELREPIAKKAQITLESHLEDLQRLRNMAAKSNQWSAAISAEIARGKAAGVNIEKSEQLVTVRKLEPIADDEFLG